MKKKVFIILRYYNQKERPDVEERDRYEFFGWSKSEDAINAFRTQRDQSKYVIKKYSREELGIMFCENGLEPENMLDYVPITIAASGDKFPFFTTYSELLNTEKKVLRMISDAARLVEKDKGNTHLLNLYMNLEDYYKTALEYIGFIPPELDALFSNESECEEAEDIIDGEIYTYPVEVYEKLSGMPGISNLWHDYQKVVFSMESFIKVLREDL